MNVERRISVVSGLIGICVIRKILKRRAARKNKKRKLWQEEWLKKRDVGKGVLSLLQNELLHEDPDAYRNFLRMDNDTFMELLTLIDDIIKKQDTQLRQSIPSDKRLAVTLRYLASGNTFRDLMYATRIHESTISIIVMEVCKAIIQNLMKTYIQLPRTTLEWENVAKGFEKLWNFPFCLGALDGKHVNFQAPKSSGSYYFNYKGSHSIVLLALVDSEYKFLYVDVGVNGRISDGGVYRESSLKKGIDRNLLNFPEDRHLPDTALSVPYVIVADDAFPLSKRIIKPYPLRGLSVEKRIFNYRLSRARRTVENAFGILTNRFRILQNTINLSPEKAEILTLTCCILHNFLAVRNKKYIRPENEINETCSLETISQQGGFRASNEALLTRNKFCDYFNTVGSVEWQNKSIGLV
ncbi:putative nuclease HARBI1 [Photinus pyralis]|nr:putative nuclease HARBI1 [Photinus pyralis]